MSSSLQHPFCGIELGTWLATQASFQAKRGKRIKSLLTLAPPTTGRSGVPVAGAWSPSCPHSTRMPLRGYKNNEWEGEGSYPSAPCLLCKPSPTAEWKNLLEANASCWQGQRRAREARLAQPRTQAPVFKRSSTFCAQHEPSALSVSGAAVFASPWEQDFLFKQNTCALHMQPLQWLRQTYSN